MLIYGWLPVDNFSVSINEDVERIKMRLHDQEVVVAIDINKLWLISIIIDGNAQSETNVHKTKPIDAVGCAKDLSGS
jgi:hypothetical protein